MRVQAPSGNNVEIIKIYVYSIASVDIDLDIKN
jgi:hypothetical protein